MAAININSIVRGSPNQIKYPVASGQVIAPGDFLWWDRANSTLKRVGGSSGLVEAWSSETQARRNALARFAGIANFYSDARSTGFDVTMDSFAISRVKVESATFNIGDMVGFSKDSGGNYLYTQTLEKVTHPYDAIGIVMEQYSSATTEVLAFILSSREVWCALANSVRQLSLHLDTTQYPAITNVLLDYTFGESVRILAAKAIVAVATTGANVFTLKNGANSMDDTLSVPGASAAGTVVTQAIDDANSYHNLEHDDQFDITCDSGASAGAATLLIEYMARPVL